jgi:hypothetical protein
LGKYDVDGNQIWTVLDVGLDTPEELTGVTIDPDGAVVVCGVVRTSPGYLGYDVVLRKYVP